MRRLFLYIFCFLCAANIPHYVRCQQINDTSYSTKKYQKDSNLLQQQVINENPHANDKTIWFYIFSFLTLSFALLKLAFPKYIKELYLLTFRSSFKQKQLREQLLQTPGASLLLNVFFVLTTGVYIAIFLQYIGFIISHIIWLNILICISSLILIYLSKYFIFLGIGWIFHIKETITTYLFTIFSVNKFIGILVLPISILLIFTPIGEHYFIINISLVLLIILFLYRYFISYNIIRGSMGINHIHFFIYLCALELMPLLIIYKILSNIY